MEGTARNRLVSYSMYIGTKIDLLGRCSSCVSGKRSVNYCRVQKLPKASPCVACYKTGFTTYKCRQELHHTTFCCVTNSDGTSYHWEVTYPIAPLHTLKYPDIDPLHGITPSSHFEFLSWEKLHFDVLLFQETSISPPNIPLKHHFMSID